MTAIADTNTKRVLRIWDEARTSHIELLRQMVPCKFVYRRENYSFDWAFARESGAIHGDRVYTTCQVLFAKYDRVELNEPTMVTVWPVLLGYSVAFRVRRALTPRSRRPLAVLYAIDNNDQRASFGRRVPLPQKAGQQIFTTVFRYMLNTFDRIVFGTEGAYDEYARVAGDIIARKDFAVMPQVPARCACGEPRKDPDRMLWIGVLEPRKGIKEALDAWDLVVAARPTARLTIIGKGKLEDYVQARVAGRDDIEFIVDPPREVIHRTYLEATAVTLLSQPAEGWREQMGLPLVDGIAHGCTVVATEQTGIASWLERSGHKVVQSDGPPEDHAAAMIDALDNPLPPATIFEGLPAEHGRIEADRWLMR